MGVRFLKNTCLLLLLISAPFLSTSFAGGRASFLNLKHDVGSMDEVIKMEQKWEIVEESVHERVLRANTHDYGKYDPAPTFVKPPFKLIPN